MRKLVSTVLLGLVGLVAIGLLSLQTASAGQADDEVTKRDDHTPDLVLVTENDDDDTNDPATRTKTNTGVSRATKDHTNSSFTAASRDRSRDVTRR